MSQKFRIASDNTKYYLTTKGEAVGSVVTTAKGAECAPADSALTVTPPPSDTPTIASIAGASGLYVALPKGAAEDAKLVWSDAEYKWVISKTASGLYEVRPASGEDLYWFDKFGIGPVIIVKAGMNVQPPQGYFTFTEA